MYRWKRSWVVSLLGFVAPGFVALPLAVHAQAVAARQSGTVTAIAGSKLSLTTTAKSQVTVSVATDAPVLQLPPCGTSLKDATPASFASIAAGDRVITGKAGDTESASRVILMKASDIATCRQRQQADWQKNGTGGLVKAVDGPVVTMAVGARLVKVDTTGTTVFRRYADDSVSFEDARTGTLAQIQPGDQISVRGAKADDGNSIAAQEVVTGTFQNLSGTLSAVDAAAGTITLKDLISKKTVTVRVTANSDLRKLPPQAAAMFARRGAGASAGTGAGTGATPAAAPAPGGPPAGEGRTRGAGADLSRALARFPKETVADLHNGDAILLVASNAQGSQLTAITLLSGVEQLLSATPAGGQPITLSPWSLGVPDGGGAGVP